MGKYHLLLVASILLFDACGKDSNSGNDSSSVTDFGNGTLQLTVSSGLVSRSPSLRLTDNTLVFKATSIASGAPDYLAISLSKLELIGVDPESGSQQVVPIFSEETGKKLVIQSGLTDISDLFTSFNCFTADGTIIESSEEETCDCGVYVDDQTFVKKEKDKEGVLRCPSKESLDGRIVVPPAAALSVPAINYSSIRMTYYVLAEMKGCVSGTFQGAVTGKHTYCTQAGEGLSEASKQEANFFENKESVLTKVPLSKSFLPDYSGTASLSFEIKDGLTLKKDETASLSLVIDANRMLRFFNQGRSDQGPNPGYPIDYSYFFTTVFEESVFVFAGRPGKVKGFSWLTEYCNADSCSDGQKQEVVQGWLTVIEDQNQDPIVLNVMPDDDNTLTILKGSNRSAGGLDKTLITKTGESTYDLQMRLSEKTAIFSGVDLGLVLNASQENVSYQSLKGGPGQAILTRKL